MKKALLIIAVVLGSMTAFAQNLDKNEAKLIKAFLSEPAKEGTNASPLFHGRTKNFPAHSTSPVSRLLTKLTCRATISPRSMYQAARL